MKKENGQWYVKLDEWCMVDTLQDAYVLVHKYNALASDSRSGI